MKYFAYSTLSGLTDIFGLSRVSEDAVLYTEQAKCFSKLVEPRNSIINSETNEYLWARLKILANIQKPWI